MKVTFICLGIASIFRIAFQFATAQEVSINGNVIPPPEKSMTFVSKIGGSWLTVRRHNDPNVSDWNPSFTNITCAYRPIVHKLNDGRYEIEFTSELAKDLP